LEKFREEKEKLVAWKIWANGVLFLVEQRGMMSSCKILKMRVIFVFSTSSPSEETCKLRNPIKKYS
jgi:hypothetical protein